MQYIAVFADICDPGAMDSQASTQQSLAQDLQAACNKLNQRRIAFGLVSPFTLTTDNEVQALFRSADELWASIFELEFAMRPARLRYGIGVGEVTTKINDQTTSGMKGDAFDQARAAIESLRADGRCFRVGGLQQQEHLVQHSLDLVSHMRSGWRENRVGTFGGLLKGDSAAQTAENLSITEQAVYRNIRDGELNSIVGLLEEISGLINQQRNY